MVHGWAVKRDRDSWVIWLIVADWYLVMVTAGKLRRLRKKYKKKKKQPAVLVLFMVKVPVLVKKKKKKRANDELTRHNSHWLWANLSSF